MAHMTERTCKWCKGKFQARTADVNRGWALFCSKSCKAMKQEKKTGQYRQLQESGCDGKKSEWDIQQDMHEQAMHDSSSCHGQDAGDGF